MSANKVRRVVDGLDDVAREMRTANLIEVLRMGSSTLDTVDVTATKSAETRRRQERMNRVRAQVRAALDLEGAGS